MKRLIHAFKAIIRRQPRLVIALAIAVIVAGATTLTSVGIYYIGNFYKLDLSRPGYEKERTQVIATSADQQKTYDASGPLTAAALNQFLSDFTAASQKTSNFGGFGSEDLSDQALQLTGSPNASAQ